MDTTCSKCTFAKYTNNIQTGCQVNRLNKFRQQGTELELQKEEDKESYLIKGRICLMCCPPERIEKLKLKNPAPELRKLITVQCEAYILALDDHSLNQVKATIDSLNMQEVRPTCINVILNTDNISRPKLVKYFNELQNAFEQKNQEYKWNITYIHERGENGEKFSDEWCLDHAIAKCNSPFYCVFMAGYNVPRNYLSSIDRALNDNIERFSVLLPAHEDSWNGVFVQTAMHKKLDGNVPQTLEEYDDGALVATTIMDKIEFLGKLKDQQYMIKKVTEVCPQIT